MTKEKNNKEKGVVIDEKETDWYIFKNKKYTKGFKKIILQ